MLALLLGLLLMPAPTNTSFGAATDLGTLSTTPTTASQRADDAGTTYPLYFKFRFSSNGVVAGALGYGDALVYRPTVFIYNAAQVEIASGDENTRLQFPGTAGDLFYLTVEPNSGNPSPATVSLSLSQAPHDDTAVGNIIVNDDTAGFPAVVLSQHSNYTPIRFVNPFPNGEAADALTNGVMLFEDFDAGNLKLFDNTFTLQATLALASGSPRIRAQRTLNQFYVGTQTNPVTVKTVSALGVYGGTTYTLTGIHTLSALAASNDGTILYHTDNATNPVVRRWDLVGLAALSNLAASLGSNYRVSDILVLADDTIVVLWVKSGADVILKRYAPDGTVQNTYNLGSTLTPIGTFPRAAYAINDPISFWVWLHPETGISRFVNVKASDGSIIRSVDHAEYELGVSQGGPSAIPFADFGPSFSCPFLVLGGTVNGSDTEDIPEGSGSGPEGLCLNSPPLMGCWDESDQPPRLGTVGAQPTTPPHGASWAGSYTVNVQQIGLIHEDVQP